jgi:hypothetical protein
MLVVLVQWLFAASIGSHERAPLVVRRLSGEEGKLSLDSWNSALSDKDAFDMASRV